MLHARGAGPRDRRCRAHPSFPRMGAPRRPHRRRCAGAPQVAGYDGRPAGGRCGRGPVPVACRGRPFGGRGQVTLVEAASAALGSEGSRSAPWPPRQVGGGGLATALALARHRVRVLTGHAVVRCEGAESVERAVVARLGPHWGPVAGSEEAVPADAVCVSHGFVPRLELARQLGAHTVAGAHHPGVSAASAATMGSSVAGLFVAGELTGVAGAERRGARGRACRARRRLVPGAA